MINANDEFGWTCQKATVYLKFPQPRFELMNSYTEVIDNQPMKHAGSILKPDV
jgi:hypothetical protein